MGSHLSPLSSTTNFQLQPSKPFYQVRLHQHHRMRADKKSIFATLSLESDATLNEKWGLVLSNGLEFAEHLKWLAFAFIHQLGVFRRLLYDTKFA